LLPLMHAGQAYDLEGLAAVAGLNGVRLLPRLLELELQGWCNGSKAAVSCGGCERVSVNSKGT